MNSVHVRSEVEFFPGLTDGQELDPGYDPCDHGAAGSLPISAWVRIKIEQKIFYLVVRLDKPRLFQYSNGQE